MPNPLSPAACEPCRSMRAHAHVILPPDLPSAAAMFEVFVRRALHSHATVSEQCALCMQVLIERCSYHSYGWLPLHASDLSPRSTRINTREPPPVCAHSSLRRPCTATSTGSWGTQEETKCESALRTWRGWGGGQNSLAASIRWWVKQERTVVTCCSQGPHTHNTAPGALPLVVGGRALCMHGCTINQHACQECPCHPKVPRRGRRAAHALALPPCHRSWLVHLLPI